MYTAYNKVYTLFKCALTKMIYILLSCANETNTHKRGDWSCLASQAMPGGIRDPVLDFDNIRVVHLSFGARKPESSWQHPGSCNQKQYAANCNRGIVESQWRDWVCAWQHEYDGGEHQPDESNESHRKAPPAMYSKTKPDSPQVLLSHSHAADCPKAVVACLQPECSKQHHNTCWCATADCMHHPKAWCTAL